MSSGITGSGNQVPGEQSSIGQRRGEIGSVALEIATSNPPIHVSPAEAPGMIRSLQQVLGSPLDTATVAGALRTVEALQRPATAKWIVARVTVLLSHYFVAATDEGVQAGMLDDWVRALMSFPAWAIVEAVDFWLGPKNPHRYRRPLPGDLVERIEQAVAPVEICERLAKRHADGWQGWRRAPVAERPMPTPEEIEARRKFAAEVIQNLYPGSLPVLGRDSGQLGESHDSDNRETGSGSAAAGADRGDVGLE